MEDILASIKRIIADDSQAAEEAVMHVEQTASGGELNRFSGTNLHLVEDREPAKRENAEEVLELTQPIETAESPAQEHGESRPQPAPASPARRHEPLISPDVASPAAIVSADAASASRQSLAALSALLVKPENENGDNTLEGLVREMLRPMMKEWLDQKLPQLVERLVEKEIARITGRLP